MKTVRRLKIAWDVLDSDNGDYVQFTDYAELRTERNILSRKVEGLGLVADSEKNIVDIYAKENSDLQAKLEKAVEALRFIYNQVGSCAYGINDKWGTVMESVYRTAQQNLKSHEENGD